MNPWVPVLFVMLVLFAWGWAFDRRRRARDRTLRPVDTSTAARRARGNDAARGMDRSQGGP